MELNKTIKINQLISLYGNMLNSNQLDIIKRYYFDDNSLSEIAEQLSITRQAISDLINRVVKILYNYEDKLNLLTKQSNIYEELKNIEQNSDSNSVKLSVEKIKSILEE